MNEDPMISAAQAANERLHALTEILKSMGGVAVAVSGGVDSLTLARAAALVLGNKAQMFHAASPAVPPSATARTVALSKAYGWMLEIVDAREFDDPAYVANPAGRCFFCKTNLYSTIARKAPYQIASGTNLDDLSEYRPGLIAARAHGVRHPFVEANIGKAIVRQISTELGMGEIAQLPGSPCLSSRVETGIAIDPLILSKVDEIEGWLRQTLKPQTVRCRIRGVGIVIEMDTEALGALAPRTRARLQDAIRTRFDGLRQPVAVNFAPYRTGSAFLVGAA